jgi:hypothetical protein
MRAAPQVAGKFTILLIYLCGVAQALALVTFPAASATFVSPTGFHLSGAGYGAMFIPRVAMAILASSSGPWLARRFGLRGVLLLGLGGDLVSMALLSASPLLIGSGAACVFAVRLHRRARQRLRRDGDGAERLGRGLVARPRGRRGVDLERRSRFSRRGRRIACAPGRRAGAHASCASQAVLAICRGGAALWPR